MVASAKMGETGHRVDVVQGRALQEWTVGKDLRHRVVDTASLCAATIH